MLMEQIYVASDVAGVAEDVVVGFVNSHGDIVIFPSPREENIWKPMDGGHVTFAENTCSTEYCFIWKSEMWKTKNKSK